MEVNLENLPIGEDVTELRAIVYDRAPPDVHYLADYDFVPPTLSAVSELLDATSDPVFLGCMVRARAIGGLEVKRAENIEYNIFAVPNDNLHLGDMRTLEDLAEQNLREIEQFRVAYRRLGRDEEAEVHGWHRLKEAHEIIRNRTG